MNLATDANFNVTGTVTPGLGSKRLFFCDDRRFTDSECIRTEHGQWRRSGSVTIGQHRGRGGFPAQQYGSRMAKCSRMVGYT